MSQDVSADVVTATPEDVVTATLEDEAPEVEMPAAETETVQQEEPEEPTPDIPDVPPTPEAAMEDATPQLEEIKASAETTATPEAPSSPAENLDHLMQVSDDEKPPDVEVPVPDPLIPEEQTVDIASEKVLDKASEEAIVPTQDTEPAPAADDVKAEPLDTQNNAEDVDQSQSKPVSRNSEASGVPDSNPTAEEAISTRRMSAFSFPCMYSPYPLLKRLYPPSSVRLTRSHTRTRTSQEARPSTATKSDP